MMVWYGRTYTYGGIEYGGCAVVWLVVGWIGPRLSDSTDSSVEFKIRGNDMIGVQSISHF
jgi:hypothetical protein